MDKAKADAETQSVIEVKQLPYNHYVWCSDLYDTIWKDRFKLFNGINENIEIEQIQ